MTNITGAISNKFGIGSKFIINLCCKNWIVSH
jgi:hypothetical protein